MNPVKFEVNANTQQAVTQVTNLFSALRQLLGPVLALGSVAGFSSLARQAINTADAIGKASKVAGLAVKEFDGLAYAAKRNEVSLETLRTGLKSFSDYLAKTGQGGRNLKEALLEQSELFEAMPDGAQKINAATERFGRGGLAWINFISEGRQSLEELFERGNRLSGMNEALAQSADEFNDSLEDLHIAAQGLAGTLALSLLPRLTQLLNFATEGIVKFRDWSQESKTFEIALKSIVVLLGTLTAYKVGIFAANGLSALLGFGALTSLKDFLALLQLMPAAATTAAISLGKFAAAIAAVTAVVLLAQGWWDFWREEAALQSTIYEEAQGIENLTQKLRDLIKARVESGELSEEEAKAFQRRIIAARELENQSDIGVALQAVKDDLGVSVPGAGERDNQSFDDFVREKKRKLEVLTNAVAETVIGMDSSRAIRMQIDLIVDQIKILQDISARTTQEFLDGMINEDAAHQIWEENTVERIKLRQQELELRRLQIDSDPTLTDAEKYRTAKAQGLPVNGTDPDSLPEQMLAKWLEFQNRIGTIQQQIADSWINVMGAAIDSTTNSIMGLIDGTMSWQDALRNVGRTILTEVIQSIVRMGVQFVMSHVLMRGAMALTSALGSLLGKKNVAETIANESAKAPSLATNAASASIGSYGYSAILGGILAVAALGAIMAAAMGGFRELGGPVEGGKVYVVGERGPELFVPPGQGQIMNNRQTMAVMNAGTKTASGGKSEPQYLVFFFDSEAAVKRFMESNQGKNITVRHVNDARVDMGFGT